LFEKLKLTEKPFYLLGHSFGGFIAAEYALKFQKNIKHLILMSPVGMPHPPERL
jgi:proline iminopeptidase